MIDSQKLKNAIQLQINSAPYEGNNSTFIIRSCMYQAFSNLLEHKPDEMIPFFAKESVYGLQGKIFQEFILILEKNLPFSFQKKKMKIDVKSLLDPNLNLFDGESLFNTVVRKNGIIKNETKEVYIGGRRSYYIRPFFIGKLNDIYDVDKNVSILDNVINYSFSQIIVKNISPGTKVKVSHLRMKPHPQMGGLLHLNRLRNKIINDI